MRLYLDDDSTSALLVRLLSRAGHDVRLPIQIGVAGKNDALHLTHGVLENGVLLTFNSDDFEELHNLLRAAGGHYPGILADRGSIHHSEPLALITAQQSGRGHECSRLQTHGPRAPVQVEHLSCTL
jgi:hypothetical protein